MRHLQGAVEDKNRDVALTGHYRAGKSNVLYAFEEKQLQSTLRTSVNILRPGTDDEDLTKSIQGTGQAARLSIGARQFLFDRLLSRVA